MPDDTSVTGVTGCAQRAYLYLARDLDPVGPPYDGRDVERMAFDPDEVSALIGLQPTEAWRRGDPSRWTRRPLQSSGWEYGLPEVTTFITEDVVIPLLDAIEPYTEGITAARRALGMRAGITVVIWMHGARDVDDDVHVSTPVIAYAGRTVQRLARLGLSVDHDQYVELPDP